MRAMYFYSVAPLAIVSGIAVLVTFPWLALLVFIGVVFGIVAGAVRVTVAASRMFIRAFGGAGGGARPAPAIPTPAKPQSRSFDRVP